MCRIGMALPTRLRLRVDVKCRARRSNERVVCKGLIYLSNKEQRALTQRVQANVQVTHSIALSLWFK